MKVRIISLHPLCAWYSKRIMFEEKTMRLCKDGHFRFYNSKQASVMYSNKVGFCFYEPTYEEIKK